MTLNRAKLGRVVTFLKYLATIVSLVVLWKTLIWNKITFSASNLLSFSELVENELMKNISKKILQYFFFYPVYRSFCKALKSLSLKNYIQSQKLLRLTIFP